MLQPRLIGEAVNGSIIGAFHHVSNQLGFGFLESLCVAALERELRAPGHDVAREDRQVYNYLRATHLEVGLLLHFGPEPKSSASCVATTLRNPFHPIVPGDAFDLGRCGQPDHLDHPTRRTGEKRPLAEARGRSRSGRLRSDRHTVTLLELLP
jgi:hypothetical protein